METENNDGAEGGSAVAGAALGSASIYEAMAVLFREGAPLDHAEIAERMGVPKFRACRCLSHLEKTGRVKCLRRSRQGLGNLPGVWNLTEAGHEFAAQWCNRLPPTCERCPHRDYDETPDGEGMWSWCQHPNIPKADPTFGRMALDSEHGTDAPPPKCPLRQTPNEELSGQPPKT